MFLHVRDGGGRALLSRRRRRQRKESQLDSRLLGFRTTSLPLSALTTLDVSSVMLCLERALTKSYPGGLRMR